MSQGKTALTPLLDALPAWMDERRGVSTILEFSAEQALTAYVRVPNEMVVVEESHLFPVPTAADYRNGKVPAVSLSMRRKILRGQEVIERPVEMPYARFLELEPTDLVELLETGSIRRHWFRAGVLCAARNGAIESLASSRKPRCVRPALAAYGVAEEGYLPPYAALEFDKRYELAIVPRDIFLQASDAELLKHQQFRPDDKDPYRLFDSAPAAFHIYSAAKKYFPALQSLSRGRSRLDKERREAVMKEVLAYFDRCELFADDPKLRLCAYWVIDPHHIWTQGARIEQRKMSEVLAERLGEKHSRENFVTDALDLFIRIAKDSIIRRAERESLGEAKDLGARDFVKSRLTKDGFGGVKRVESLATIILWQGERRKATVTAKVKRKTESIKSIKAMGSWRDNEGLARKK